MMLYVPSASSSLFKGLIRTTTLIFSPWASFRGTALTCLLVGDSVLSVCSVLPSLLPSATGVDFARINRGLKSSAVLLFVLGALEVLEVSNVVLRERSRLSLSWRVTNVGEPGSSRFVESMVRWLSPASINTVLPLSPILLYISMLSSSSEVKTPTGYE